MQGNINIKNMNEIIGSRDHISSNLSEKINNAYLSPIKVAPFNNGNAPASIFKTINEPVFHNVSSPLRKECS